MNVDARALLDIKFEMVWLYRSPIPVGRRGVFYSFKWFLPAFVVLGGGGGQHSVDETAIEAGKKLIIDLDGLITKLAAWLNTRNVQFIHTGDIPDRCQPLQYEPARRWGQKYPCQQRAGPPDVEFFNSIVNRAFWA